MMLEKYYWNISVLMKNERRNKLIRELEISKKHWKSVEKWRFSEKSCKNIIHSKWIYIKIKR